MHLHFLCSLSLLLYNFFCLCLPPILCFWCFLTSFSHPSPHSLSESEPNPRAQGRIKKSGPLIRAGGPKMVQMACGSLLASHPAVPQVRASPAPAAPQPQSQGRWGIRCAGMALLLWKLWKPAPRNRSELIRSGEPPGLGGGGEAKLCTLNFALLLPAL